MASETWFDHERLEVYREAVAFVAWLSTVLEGAVRVGEVKDQLDRASTSVPLNIAEGNGNTPSRTVAGSLISLTAPHSNALPAWTFLSPKES